MAYRFDNLLTPISKDSPAGDARLYSRQLRDSFASLRKPEQPNSEADTNYRRSADWTSLEKIAQSALSNQTKDIRIACHLVEAWTQIRGFSGLKDGLLLLTNFVEHCWERSNPTIEDQDFETRLSPLENMLDDVDRGFCFPLTVRSIPLLGDSDHRCDYFQFQELHQSKDDKQQRTLNQIVEATDPIALVHRGSDIANSLAQLAALKTALQKHVGNQAPGFTYLRDAILDCQRIVAAYAPQLPLADTPHDSTACQMPPESLLVEHGIEMDSAPLDSHLDVEVRSDQRPGATEPSAVEAVHTPKLPPLNSRQAAYQLLVQVADFLKQAEPHSPVPYLIERAVSLGQMPFPMLAQQMIREEGILDDLRREFGIQTSSAVLQDV